MEHFRIEIEDNLDVVGVRYIQAEDYFNAYEKALNTLDKKPVAVMKTSDFYYKVVENAKRL